MSPAPASSRQTSNQVASQTPGMPAAGSPLIRLSPSLVRGADHQQPAFEVKFVLEEALARRVEEHLAPLLHLDPYADPALGDAYRIHSLYTDTPEFGVFRRDGLLAFSKLRVRRYGDSDAVFLERKTVKRSQVRKRREACDVGELAQPRGGDPGQPGAWFFRRAASRGLRPVCRLSYLRRAYAGDLPDGPFRLTFDREIRAVLVGGWTFDAMSEEKLLLPGQVVCEFKFRSSLPAAVKRVIGELQIAPTGLSKYRTCVRAFGLASELHGNAQGDDHA